MSETKQEGKERLFREKSLEALDSPESLNDYLKVTSPRVWLVLAAVIALLIGAILWGILGRIDTRRQAALVTSDQVTTCYVPFDTFDTVQMILKRNEVTVDGQTYSYRLPEDGSVNFGYLSDYLDDQTISRACIVGNLNADAKVMAIPVDAALEDGVRPGTVTTETLHPISLLLK